MLKLTRRQRVRLVDLADATIRRTLEGDAGAPAALNHYEAVGSTVSTALPATADAWQAPLRPLGLKVNVIGSFSFGAPKVEVVESGVAHCVDLGAVLIIVDDQSGSTPDRRALLLGSGLQGETAQPAQRRLYAEWPAFRFTGAAYGDEWRDFRSPEAAPAGYFARVELGQGAPAWTLSPCAGSGKRRARVSLGGAIVAMFAGAGGRKATPGGSDAWSRTVDELLNRTAGATVAGLGRHPTVRSATTYKSACGAGLVVVQTPEGLPLEAAFAQIAAPDYAPPEGPMSVAHFICRKVEPFDYGAGTA